MVGYYQPNHHHVHICKGSCQNSYTIIFGVVSGEGWARNARAVSIVIEFLTFTFEKIRKFPAQTYFVQRRMGLSSLFFARRIFLPGILETSDMFALVQPKYQHQFHLTHHIFSSHMHIEIAFPSIISKIRKKFALGKVPNQPISKMAAMVVAVEYVSQVLISNIPGVMVDRLTVHIPTAYIPRVFCVCGQVARS